MVIGALLPELYAEMDRKFAEQRDNRTLKTKEGAANAVVSGRVGERVDERE